jgi:hypothetical protein
VLTPHETNVCVVQDVVVQPAVDKPTLAVGSPGPKFKPEIVVTTPEDVGMLIDTTPDVTGLSKENELVRDPDCAMSTATLKPPLTPKPAETAQETVEREVHAAVAQYVTPTRALAVRSDRAKFKPLIVTVTPAEPAPFLAFTRVKTGAS